MLSRSGHLDQALELIQAVVPKYEELLGQNHPSTLNVLNNLADVLAQMGRFSEAQSLLEGVVERARTVFGDEYPLVLTSRNNLATILYKLGEIKHAMETCTDIVALRTRVLGRIILKQNCLVRISKR